MENVKDDNPLGYEKINKLLLKFCLPSILAMLISSLYNLVDQIFIGQGLGYIANGATNVSYPLTSISLAIALLIGIGSASNVSILLGEGRQKDANKIAGNAIWMMLVLGISIAVISEIFITPLLYAFGTTDTVFPYALDYASIIIIGMPFLIINNSVSNLIRADGNPKYSMICMFVGALLNTALDPLFIFVFKMGVSGAAIATVISQVVSCIVSVIYIPRFKKIHIDKEALSLDFKKIGRITSLGMSNFLNQIAIIIVQIVTNNSLTHYGALTKYGSDIPLSAFGIVMKVNSLCLAFFIGINQGTQPIMGYNYGAKNYKRVKETFVKAMILDIIIASIGLFFFQVFPIAIISIFVSADSLFLEFAAKTMRIFLMMIVLVGIQFICTNLFSSIGKPGKGIFLSLSRQIIFLIPLLIILPLFIGLDGVLFAAPISDTLSFTISIILVILQFKKFKKQELEQ